MSGGKNIENGIIYEPADYAGFWRRLLIVVVDGAILSVAMGVLGASWIGLELPAMVYPAVLLVGMGAYLVIPKAKGPGTAGYVAAGVRLVGLDGERPSVPRTAVRSLIVMVFPGMVLLDLFWLLGSPQRQGLRDKLLGMYVVKRSARPVARVPVRESLTFALGYGFSHPEVTEASPNGSDDSGSDDSYTS